ncbi:MAG: fumarate hydratase [Clostridiales bacterium]|nr:fumarate hydratase [Clostridiales bacterium]
MHAEDIASTVRNAIPRIATELRTDVLAAIREALARERSPRGRAALEQLAANAGIAAHDGVPLCQDTGYVWVWLEVGAEECVCGDLTAAIDAAVAEAYASARLRASLARDALLDRANTGDNTPAFVDITVRPGCGATVHVMLKGGGSDNASALAMLSPAEGEEGVVAFVLESVAAKVASACPPVVVGVGVGSTFDKVGTLAKRALLREVGTCSADERIAALEARLLAGINASGVGPGGLGGDTTALAVHVVTAPCHIAALPVAVNVGCSAVRSVTVEVLPR